MKMSDHLEKAINRNQDLIKFLLKNDSSLVIDKIIEDVENGKLADAHALLTTMIEFKKGEAPKKVKPPKKVSSMYTLYNPSTPLTEVLGSALKITRTEAVRKLWVYIKANKMQDPKNQRTIILDDKLKAVFGSNKQKITMFEIANGLNAHLKK